MVEARAGTAWRTVAGWSGARKAGVAILALLVAIAILAPVISPASPNALLRPMQPPGAGHPLGTDQVGYDLLTQLFFGARTALIVGGAAAGLGLALSTVVALVAGYRGGLADLVLMRTADLFLVLPRLPLLLLLITLTGPGLLTITIVIAVLSWPWGARIVRAQVMSLRTRTHVRASELFGGSGVYVARRHLLPELAPILVSEFVANARLAVLIEVGLGFLGLSDPSSRDWGSTLHAALVHPGIYFGSTWIWWVLPPAIALTLLIVGFMLVGMSFETRWNPRLESGQ